MIHAAPGGPFDVERVASPEIIEKLIKALDVDSTNIIFERRSRNTLENSAYTKTIIKDLQIKNWGIVTSASHMKRAIATFNYQSSVISFDPIPVDFQTKNSNTGDQEVCKAV